MVYKPGYCPMCNAIPGEMECTLHGGHMTATEVRLRGKYEILHNRWVERKPMRNPLMEALVDSTYALMRRTGFLK